MKIGEISKVLSNYAPRAFQESYDNTGLLVGDSEAECKGVICCHDLNEKIIEEAISGKCNLIVCHHPPIFSCLKSVLRNSEESRLIYLCIEKSISIFSTHTALDNQLYGGNYTTATKLGLQNIKILRPSNGNLLKLYSYAPEEHIEAIKTAIHKAGAGKIGNYSECSFEVKGKGSFKPEEGAEPTLGSIGDVHYEEEVKFEVILTKDLQSKVLKALFSAHPYEEVAYEMIALENSNQQIGSGLIGEFSTPLETEDFLKLCKNTFKTGIVKHNNSPKSKIKKLAICGGSGSFLLSDAIRAEADAFVTGDIGYHRFFDSEGQILLCDVGHFESERFVAETIYNFLIKKFPTFAVHLAETGTNPVNYF